MPVPVPAPQDTTGPKATPSPAEIGSAIAPAPAPVPVPTTPNPADAGSALAPTAGASPPGAGAPAETTAQTNPQTINPDAPPMVQNPTPATGTGGVSVGASYYDGVGGGATLVATPQGIYIVPEFGIGIGPSVSAAAGSNVNVPNAPQLQLGVTGGDQIGPIGYRGSSTITVPLNDPSNPNVGLNLGLNAPGNPSLTNFPGTSVPLTNLRVSGNYSPAAGLTGGLQYSGTNQLFNVTDQVKLAVRVPIPLPDPTQTTPRDTNGVSDMTTPTGEVLRRS